MCTVTFRHCSTLFEQRYSSFDSNFIFAYPLRLFLNYLFIYLLCCKTLGGLCVRALDKKRWNGGAKIVVLEKINFSNFPASVRATQKLLREFPPSFFSSVAYYSYQEVKQSTFHLDPFRRSWRVAESCALCHVCQRIDNVGRRLRRFSFEIEPLKSTKN